MTARGLSRRALLGAAALFPLAARAMASGRASERRRHLWQVRDWGCQYQNVDIAALEASSLDMIAIDPSLDDDRRVSVTAEDCRRLKRRPDGARRVVLAYLSVGEADIKRWYWPRAWVGAPPDWVGAENPAWPGARAIRYWRPEWRGLVFEHPNSLLDMIVRTGFDGVLLDRVDAYGDWPDERERAMAGMKDLLLSLAARARAANPDFLIVIQNAEPLASDPDIMAVIDGHNKESLLTGLNPDGGLNRAADVEWSLAHLERVQRAGIATFATEYSQEPDLREPVERRLRELGFVPFFATPALDRLPGRQ